MAQAATNALSDDDKPINVSISPKHLWIVVAFLVGGGGAGIGTSLIARPSSAAVEEKIDRVVDRLTAIELTLARQGDGRERDAKAIEDIERRLRVLEAAR